MDSVSLKWTQPCRHYKTVRVRVRVSDRVSRKRTILTGNLTLTLTLILALILTLTKSAVAVRVRCSELIPMWQISSVAGPLESAAFFSCRTPSAD